jgi:S-DNA-T family DNA segregation ATPase FtsK/SpoIIIE
VISDYHLSIGRDETGQPVDLPLRANGLCTGSTGAGKSELLRTVVAGVLLNYSPAELTVALVDVKGAMTFRGLNGTRHVTAHVTNISDDLALVHRLHDVLVGELARRAAAETPRPPLLVCVDEFSDLVVVRPDFADLLARIGREGPVLGVHLLLSSSYYEPDRIRDLLPLVDYHVGLKTFGIGRHVPGTEDLPPVPGTGLLVVGGNRPVRFQTHLVPDGHVAGPPGPPVHLMWWPPLGKPQPRSWRPDRLQAVIGLVDKPLEHRHDELRVDFSTGHGAIVGRAGSGRSTLLRTVITSLALTHSPEDVRFYCVDMGGELAGLAESHHVGAIARRHEAHKVRRIVEELAAPDQAPGDVFLVVDGWTEFVAEFPALAPVVRQLDGTVHVVVTADRWADVAPFSGVRLELRMEDPSESFVESRLPDFVPLDQPGRGLTPDALHFMASLPQQDVIESANAAWPGLRVPAVDLLPDVLPYAELIPRPIPLGVESTARSRVHLDFGVEQHFLALGGTGWGKTAVLRTILRGITTAYTPAEAVVLLVDYRSTLKGVLKTEHLLRYATTATDLADMVKEVVESLSRRISATHTGPELVVVVDDYDLVGRPGANPLAPLAELLPHAKEIGLHLVLALHTASSPDPLLDGPAAVLTGSGATHYGVEVTQPPGRGTLVVPGRAPQRVQVAWIPG